MSFSTNWKVTANQGTVIPIIDIGPFVSGSASEQASVAAEVGAACEDIGFFLIAGHGVAPEDVSTMYEVTTAFFELPREFKSTLLPTSTRSYRGYRSGEFRETIEVGRYDDAGDARGGGYSEQWAAKVEANVWPSEPAELRRIWRSYFATCEQLAGTVMEIFAEALDLPRTWFASKFDRDASQLSANYYPPMPAAAEEDEFRLGAHSDLGSLTILYQDAGPGGLEVLDRRGRWCRVPAVDGTFVANLGDLMAMWTNDRWVATQHRVVQPGRDERDRGRISIPFFQSPNYDALIECIPTCADPSDPARYPSVYAGDWAESRTLNNYQDVPGRIPITTAPTTT